MIQSKIIKGISVPSIGLGTYDQRGKACETVLESALELGYRHIDTAQMYDNENSIGNVLGNTSIARDDIFITTKVWPANYPRDRFFRSVEQSMKDLQIEQVDLLLLHWPKEDKINIEAAEYLLKCFEMGYAKKIGVSNFSVAQLQQAQKQAPIFCNQVPPQSARYMPKEDLLVTIYSPMKLRSLMNDGKLKDIADKYHKTPVQVLLRSIIQQPNITTIPKASSLKHMKENMDIFDFELNTNEMRDLGY